MSMYDRLDDVLLGEAELIQHATDLAKQSPTAPAAANLPSLALDMKRLTSAYSKLTDGQARADDFCAGSWLVDNFHLLEQIVCHCQTVRLPKLPKLQDKQGEIRAFALAADLVGHRQGKLTIDLMERYIQQYCQSDALMMREIHALQPLLMVALVKLCAMQAAALLVALKMCARADSFAKNSATQCNFKNEPLSNCFYVERLSASLRQSDALLCLQEELLRQDTDIATMTKNAHDGQLKITAIIKNCICSLRLIQKYDWSLFFGAVSRVEKTLKSDAVYCLMTQESKAYYRRCIERISKKSKAGELAVAKAALDLAIAGQNQESAASYASHVGYYLCDEGKSALLKTFHKDAFTPNDAPLPYYLTALFSLTALLLILPIAIALSTDVLALLLLFPAFICAHNSATRIYQRFLSKLEVRQLACLRLDDGICEANATLVVIPALVDSVQSAKTLTKQLEVHYCASRLDNVSFCLLCDVCEHTQEVHETDSLIVAHVQNEIQKLNDKYEGNKQPIFYYVFRKRTRNADGLYAPHERKRGALQALNRALLDIQFDFSCGSLPKAIKYVLTLDSDTRLPLGELKKFIGTISHPLNAPVLKNDRVLHGYGVIAPRVELSAKSAQKTAFSRLFAQPFGFDAYSMAISETYQDVFGQGNFGGKGIYDVRAFYACTQDLPDNVILSHDLLEGSLVGCGFASGILVFDEFPSTYFAFEKRAHRWMRGDWQLLPLLGLGKLTPLARYKMLDNLSRSLLSTAVVTLLLASASFWGGVVWALLALLPLGLDLLFGLLANLAPTGDLYMRIRDCLKEASATLGRTFFAFATLPHDAYTSCDAAIRALYRANVSHKKILEWNCAQTQSVLSVRGAYQQMLANVMVATLAVIIGILAPSLFALLLAAVWYSAPYFAAVLCKPTEHNSPTKKQQDFLYQAAQACYTYFTEQTGAQYGFLPPDNIQFSPKKAVALRTSPTNIGFALVAPYAAFCLQLIDQKAYLEQTRRLTDTIVKLETYHGHLYNWYDIRTQSPLKERFVSAVDSGNFGACLLCAIGGLKTVCESEAKELIARLQSVFDQTEYDALFDAQANLFYIGFDGQNGKLIDSHYDLLASEARLLSLVAIAKGDVAPTHWFCLARPLTEINAQRLLISWSGTMFEYLMPRLFIAPGAGSLLDQSERSCVTAQMEHFKGTKVPWGVSESGYAAFDLALNYQYHAFGIDGAGIKVNRSERVVAPYATALATMIQPTAAIDNLKAMKALGAYGEYGFIEALDFTKSRVKRGEYAKVNSFMVHHKGMSLLAYCNTLCENAIVKAFMQNPQIEAASLLLDERAPSPTVVIRQYAKAMMPATSGEFASIDINVNLPMGLYPQAYPLGTDLSLLVCSDGQMRARWQDYLLYSSSLDAARPDLGCYVLAQNTQTGQVVNLNKANVQFLCGKVVFSTQCEDIALKLEVCASTDGAQLGRVEITNPTQKAANFNLFLYIAVSLSKPSAELAHRTFERLFVQSALIDNGLLFWRNEKDGNSNIALAVTATHPAKMGNSRMEVLGSKLSQPAFLQAQGCQIYQTPVEPCAFFSLEAEALPGQTQRYGFALCPASEQRIAQAMALEYKNLDAINDGFDLAWTSAQVHLKHLAITPQLMKAYSVMAAQLFMKSVVQTGKKPLKNANQQDLWRMSISGDLPIALCEVEYASDCQYVLQALCFKAYMSLYGHQFDLVLIDGTTAAYEQSARTTLENACRSYHLPINEKGGVFILHKGDISEGEHALLAQIARLRIANKLLCTQFEPHVRKKHKPRAAKPLPALALKLPALEHFNTIGGFDGPDYVMQISHKQNTPLPWSNIMTNERFGSLITQSGGGYTWADNARECKLTAWSNDPVQDLQTELLFLKDESNGFVWSVTPAPLPCGEYIVRHGRGFSTFACGANGLEQELCELVCSEDQVKLLRVRIANPLQQTRTLCLYFYVGWVMGAFHEDALLYAKKEGNAILCHSAHGCGYIACNREFSYTTSNEEFFAGELSGVYKPMLEGQPGFGEDCCSAMCVPIEIQSGETTEVILQLGYASDADAAAGLIARYQALDSFETQLFDVTQAWGQKLEQLQVHCADSAFSRMCNSALLYQVYNSRLQGRTGFYQAGGAYGFRDQLQDTLALLYTNPARTKEQILLCAAHQFEDGDVMHWWHQPNKGVRTQISDDLLFLPYCTYLYATATGDESIWQTRSAYIKNVPIPEGKSDVYITAEQSDVSESIFEHCARAIERASVFGAQGLPMMGSGDWNDGMDEVRGQSVWLGWLLYCVLKQMSEVAKTREAEQDRERGEVWQKRAKTLLGNIEKNAWDGNWYKRAFFHDGTPLGSKQGSEAVIDSISQTWAVFSNGGEQKRTQSAMQEVDRQLVDKKGGIIKLLTPPLKNMTPRAGYIQAYGEGLRENGGQYTHAAAWVVLAFSQMGDKEKALDLFKLINPISHGDNPIIMQTYKGEPYAMAGDVYSNHEHVGRAGWTQYTGSAAWMYIAALDILGFKKCADVLTINTQAVQVLGDYTIDYKFGNSLYKLHCITPNVERQIELVDDYGMHALEI